MKPSRLSPTDVIGLPTTSESARNVVTALPISTLRWSPVAVTTTSGPGLALKYEAINLAVMTDGDQLQWHFDQTDFVVSLAVQDAEEGGDFEVAPRIRDAGDERYDAVAKVLHGARDAGEGRLRSLYGDARS